MTEKCKHCGMIHDTECPYIKSIEYYEDGTVKRIEYMTPADFMAVPVYQYPIHRPVIIPQPYCPPVIPYWHTTTTCRQINTTGGSHSTLYG